MKTQINSFAKRSRDMTEKLYHADLFSSYDYSINVVCFCYQYFLLRFVLIRQAVLFS